MTKKQALQTLGLKRDASNAQIKQAYHEKAILLHPDKNPDKNTHEQFISVVEAYEILIGKRKAKSIYDSDTSNQQSSSTRKKTNFHFRNPNHTHRNYNHNFSQEDFEMRYARAKAAYEENYERKSQRIYQQNFDEYMNGYKRKFAKIMAAFGLVLIALFSLDYYVLPTNYQEITLSTSKLNYEYTNNNISYYSFDYLHQKIIIDNKTLHKIITKKEKIYVFTTTIFKDVVSLNKEPRYNFNRIPIYNYKDSLHHNSLIFFLLFIIPTLTFWVEHPNFNFVFFGVYYNTLIFPLLTLYILINDLRILRVFESF